MLFLGRAESGHTSLAIRAHTTRRNIVVELDVTDGIAQSRQLDRLYQRVVDDK